MQNVQEIIYRVMCFLIVIRECESESQKIPREKRQQEEGSIIIKGIAEKKSEVIAR